MSIPAEDACDLCTSALNESGTCPNPHCPAYVQSPASRPSARPTRRASHAPDLVPLLPTPKAPKIKSVPPRSDPARGACDRCGEVLPETGTHCSLCGAVIVGVKRDGMSSVNVEPYAAIIKSSIKPLRTPSFPKPDSSAPPPRISTSYSIVKPRQDDLGPIDPPKPQRKKRT